MARRLSPRRLARPASKGAGWSWSDEPFAGGLFGDYAGKIAVKARNADLLPQLAAREFAATLNFDKQELSLDEITGDIAGGRLTGKFSLHAADDGLHARGKFALAGRRHGCACCPRARRPPIVGKLAAVRRSRRLGPEPGRTDRLAARLRALSRSAMRDLPVSIRAHSMPSHTPSIKAWSSIRRAFPIWPARRCKAAALRSNARREIWPSAPARSRLSKFTADSSGAQLSAAGGLDLTTGSIDGRLVLSGAGAAGPRPDIFMALKGPMTAPERTIDVSALTGWLTLRSIENESKKIRAIEQAPAEPAAAAAEERSGAAACAHAGRQVIIDRTKERGRSRPIVRQAEACARLAAAGRGRTFARAGRRGAAGSLSSRLATLTRRRRCAASRAEAARRRARGNNRERTGGSPTTDCRGADRYRWSPPSRKASNSRPLAISFKPCQNASSRLTLVLCPAITIERLTTGELIDRLLCRSGADRGLAWL